MHYSMTDASVASSSRSPLATRSASRPSRGSATGERTKSRPGFD